MKKLFRLSAPLVAALFLPLDVSAAREEGPDRVELEALREKLVEGITKGDMDLIEPLLHPNVVVTWQDGQVNKGPAAVRKFYEEMAAKSKKTFQGYKVPPTPDEPTILYSGGTAGVVYGRNTGVFHLFGRDFEMHNRWTATLVKEDGRWQMASYHVSMNVLDNPLLNSMKTAGGVMAVLGALAGAAIMWLLARRKRRAA